MENKERRGMNSREFEEGKTTKTISSMSKTASQCELGVNHTTITFYQRGTEIRLSKRLVVAGVPSLVMPSTCSVGGATRESVWHLNT